MPGPKTISVLLENSRSEASKTEKVEKWVDTSNIVSVLGLEETNTVDAKKSYFGIPEDKIVYTREWKDWYYYFDDKGLVFIPELKNILWSNPCCIRRYDTKTNDFTKEYPIKSDHFKKYLEDSLNKILNDHKIPTNWKEIWFNDNDGKYYLFSHEQKISIELSTLTKWWIFEGPENLWKNLQLLNLTNFIKSEFGEDCKKTGVSFSCDKHGYVCLSNNARTIYHDVFRLNNNISDKYPFFMWADGIDSINKYVEYLNANLIPKE